jgi:glycosyl transferase family 2
MPPELSVVAIVAAYNEADIIGQVVGDLIEHNVQVYVLDDGSTDGTADAVERFVGDGVLQIERLPAAGRDTSPAPFDWERILRRKAELAQTLRADWFIHHDADEFRESPWRGVPLADAIRRVDALGFNAIDFLSLDFWPVHDRFRAGDDVRAEFTHYAARAPYDRVQIRCWKNVGRPVDLASSGGHEAQFDGRNVFPVRFISRHYPIRSQAHGERKVFQERQGRFREEERARGWHVQYDAMHEGMSFIRDPTTLTPYDPDAVRVALTLRHRGVEALEASLDEMQCAVAELSRQRREAIRQIEELTAAQATCVDNLQHAVDEGARRIDELHRSLSWRWTAPARAALRALRGR